MISFLVACDLPPASLFVHVIRVISFFIAFFFFVFLFQSFRPSTWRHLSLRQSPNTRRSCVSCTIPRASYGNTIVGKEGFPNPLLFGFLFADPARGIRFRQDCGLLKIEMFCIKCESNMSFCRSAESIDEYRWKCCKGKRGQRIKKREVLFVVYKK
jgi:hypothetical protein